MVHPIERLRFVARSSGAPQDLLVRETATALAAFSGDPSGLVTACRRIVSRQLTSGPIWWLCSRMLCAVDPWAEAGVAVDDIEADPTSRRLAEAIPDDAVVAVIGWQPQVAAAIARRGDVEVRVIDALGEADSFVRHLGSRGLDAYEIPISGLGAAVASADLVLLEATAFGSEGLMISGSMAAAATARHAGVPVWTVGGVGRVLPGRIWSTLVDRMDLADEPWDADDELVALDLVDLVAGPAGLESSEDALRRCDCPIAPELLRADIT